MSDRELAEHPLHHARQILPRGDVGEERLVLRLHGIPVVAVHVRVIEVIAVDPPAFVEDLTPLGGRVDLHFDTRDAEFVLARIDLAADVRDRIVVLHLQQHAFAVAGDVERVDLFEERVFLLLGQAVMRQARVDRVGLIDRGALEVVQLAGFRHLKIRVIRGRQRDGHDPLAEAIGIDSDRDRLLVFVFVFVLILIFVFVLVLVVFDGLVALLRRFFIALIGNG